MIKPIFILFGILAIASSFDWQVEKDFFFVGNNNKFKSTLFQTKTHVIVQSIEFPSNSQPVPQYLALDLTTGNATQILAEVSAACDPATYLFGKLIYHDSSDKLVYYCANNNTVLFIDQDGFHVNDYISVGGSNVYPETRLIADGDNLVILGINDFFGKTPSDTQFIRVDLVARKVVTDMSLGGYLKTPQTVVAFASSKLEQYVLASSTDGQNETISLYFMLWAESILKLVPVSTTTYNTNGTSVIHHLYVYGTNIVTNTATDMIVFNQVGNVLYTFPNLTSTKVYTAPGSFAWELSYGNQYGSQDLYLLFNNDTMAHLTVSSGHTVTSQTIGTASQMMVVIGSTQQDDLLFVISDQGPLFNVLKATTQEILYSRPNAYRNLMMTNTTYAAELYPYLFIFDSSKDTLIANVTIGVFYYHDTDHGVVYFLNSTGSYNDTVCTLLSLDLTTAKFNPVYKFDNASYCVGTITAVDASDASSPQVSIQLYNSSFLVLTKNNGLLMFNPPAPSSGRNVVAYSLIDFSTFNLQYISSQDYQAYTVASYTYDSSSNSFVSSQSTPFNLPAAYPISNIYTIGSTELIAVSNQIFTYVNTSDAHPVNQFDTSFIRAQMSKFHDGNGNTYTIFTEDPRYNLIRSVQPPALFDFSNLNQLPETSTNTTQAGAAGFCSYWTVEGMITSVGVVKFYSGCSGARTESIYA